MGKYAPILGDALTAVDLYAAAFMALFRPLPAEHCLMPDAFRAGFEAMDEATARALDAVLLEHRDFVYDRFLELPLSP